MKRFISKSILALAAVLTLASCAKEKYETEQFGGAPTLTAFAPNPVYRGGELTFIGSYLEQVAEVQVPGVDPITEITVETSGAKSRIKVTLPNSTEEVGVITLVTKSGAKLVSKAELTYTEPVVFGDFSPKSAMPGDVVTVTGDYMNLIQEVIFAGSAYAVGEAISDQTRKELKVVVPDNAISGRFILGDTDEVADPDNVANKVYSTGEITIGDPKITALGEVSPKSGDKLTVSGQYLNMIAAASVSGVAVEFTVEAGNKHGEKLVFAVPETAADGEIVLTSYAGKEFVAGKVKTVVPTGLAIAAERFKAGLDATISGQNLDLVTGVTIGGAACEYSYDATKKAITTTISAKSVDGAVVLSLANGKTVTIEGDVELVKPVITSVAPLELYAGDEAVVVAGTDLDLVVSATLGGKDEAIEFKEDSLYVGTTVSSVGGAIVLKLANGVEVTSAEEVVMNYHALVIVTERPSGQHINEEVRLVGSNMNLVETIYVGDAKVTKYISRADDEIRFLMPYNKIGTYSMKFVLYSGDEEVQPQQIEVWNERDLWVLWEGEAVADDWANQPYVLSDAGLELAAHDAQPGWTLYFHATVTSDWKLQIVEGHWGDTYLSVCDLGADTEDGKFTEWDLAANGGVIKLTLTQEMLEAAYTQQWWGGTFVLNGDNVTITKIELEHVISQEVVLWEGEAVADDWANQPYVLSDAGLELAEAGAKVGQEIRFYATVADDWKLQIVEGHWGDTYLSVCAFGADTEEGKFTEYDLAANGGYIKLPITQAMLDAAYTQQWWGGTFVLNGDNVTVTKITLF